MLMAVLYIRVFYFIGILTRGQTIVVGSQLHYSYTNDSAVRQCTIIIVLLY